MAGHVLFLVLDLLGVAVLAFSGALAAIRARLDVFGVVVLGVITSLGGGALRDVLLREIPLVLHREIYALPVLGAALVGRGIRAGLPSTPVLLAAAVLVAGLRLLAIWRRWDAPRPRRPRATPPRQ